MLLPKPRGLDVTVDSHTGRVGRSLFALVLGAVFLGGFTTPAHADVAKAKAHYERGQALYQIGEYRRALDEFKEAHVEKPDPAFLYNIAQSYRQLGDRENALVFYRRFLSMSPESPLRPDVERRIHELEDGAVAPLRPPNSNVAASAAPAARPRMVMEAGPADTKRADAITHGTDAARPPLPRWVPWTAAGVTLVVGALAVVNGRSASNLYDELHGSCGQTPEGCTQSQVDELRSRARTANILWAAMGLAAVGTGATIYVNTREAGIAGLWRF